jgi:hypothetical protein
VTPPPEPTGSLALEIERLRGTLGTGVAEIKGSLALLVQRSDQTDRALGEQRDQLVSLEKRCDAIELATTGVATHGGRIASLERWMWLAIGASTALGTVGGWIAGSLLR